MRAGRSPEPGSRSDARRIWMTLAIICTAVAVVGLVSAIVTGSAGWWVLVAVMVLTATFDWSRYARERH